MRPGGAMLAVIQDRIEQKDWLRRNGFPVGEYRAVRSLDELREAIASWADDASARARRVATTGAGRARLGFAPGAFEEEVGARGRLWAKGRRGGEGCRAGAGDLCWWRASPRGEVKVIRRRGTTMSSRSGVERHAGADCRCAWRRGAGDCAGDCGHLSARGHSCGGDVRDDGGRAAGERACAAAAQQLPRE